MVVSLKIQSSPKVHTLQARAPGFGPQIRSSIRTLDRTEIIVRRSYREHRGPKHPLGEHARGILVGP